MMPLKIEILENDDIGYNITILGIGEVGREIVSKYPLPAYGKNHWAIQTLFLCDDDAFQHKRYPKVFTPQDEPCYLAKCRKQICEVIENSDVLFVVADTNKDPDYENAFRFANFHRSCERESNYNILVNFSDDSKPCCSDSTIEDVFDLIIYHQGTSKIHRTMEMLLTDMYAQFIGLDFMDMQTVIEPTPKMKFFEKCAESPEKLKKIIHRLDEEIKANKRKDAIFNGMLYLSIPHCEGLDILIDLCDILRDSSINGNLIFQLGLNAEEDDETYTVSLLCGEERIRKEESNSNGKCLIVNVFIVMVFDNALCCCDRNHKLSAPQDPLPCGYLICILSSI